jgi:uncharacterized protein (TIGR00297 family)
VLRSQPAHPLCYDAFLEVRAAKFGPHRASNFLMATLAIASCWLPTDPWSTSLALALFVPRTLPVLSLTFAFALTAWGMRAVTFSGAVAGLLVTTLICLAAGFQAFLAVFTVFLLTYIATRLGYGKKQRLGAAEHHEGRRASQVFANLGAAAMCVAPMLFFPNVRGLLIGMTAALAEAAADTVSSELGQAFNDRPLLLTTLEPVQPGTNGGISLIGSISGFLAACIVTAVAISSGLMYPHWFWLVVVGATLGMFVDSLLGATVEAPNALGNDSVNFLSSTFSAFIVLLAWLIHQIRL